VLSDHDLCLRWVRHDEREVELAWVHERAAYQLGFDHGSADALAAFLRRRTGCQSKPALRVGD
jgi:hypothetical protein